MNGNASPIEISESPVLLIRDYAFTFHVVTVDHDGDARAARVRRRSIRSFERDMLSYAYRDASPFYTSVVPDLPDDGRLTVEFPDKLRYKAEVRDKWSVATHRLRRTMLLRAAVTDFISSKYSVVHLTLAPFPASDESELDEYAIIKLMKLWEGGEGMPPPGSDEEQSLSRQGRLPKFSFSDDSPLSFDDLVGAVFGRAMKPRKHQFQALDISAMPPQLRLPLGRRRHRPSTNLPAAPSQALATRAGTVEIVLPGDPDLDSPARPHWFFQALLSAKDDRAGFEQQWSARTCTPDWDRLVAIGGVVQGLFDFRDIDASELADVFAGLAEDDKCLLSPGVSISGFHKGSLLHIAAETLTRSDAVGGSPYHLIPHAVLLHNDECLRSALEVSNRLVSAAPSARQALTGAKVSIRETSASVEKQRVELSNLLPNVFHYPAERSLFTAGLAVRGLDELAREMHQRTAVEGHLLENRLKRRDTYGVIAGIALTVAGALQAAGRDSTLVPWWIAISLFLAIIVVYAVLRRLA